MLPVAYSGLMEKSMIAFVIVSGIIEAAASPAPGGE